MQIRFLQPFSKQIDSLRNDSRRNKLREIVECVRNAETVRDIPNLKKMKGHRSAYRIRVGDFRVGMYIKDNTVIFADFDHRKDIYTHFP